MKDTKITKDGKTYLISQRMTENRWFWLFTIYEIDAETNKVKNLLGKRQAMRIEDALDDVLKEANR